MIERKKKPCIQCLQEKFIFSHGRCKECDTKVKSLIKKVKKKEKKEKIPELIKKLDEVFSKYIRLRNADENGLVRCFTSGIILHWTKAHAGHFISRRHLGTRWNEINVQVQSVSENMFNQGNSPEFGRKIIEIYGKEQHDNLFVQSTLNKKFSRFELQELILIYENKLKEYEKNRTH